MIDRIEVNLLPAEYRVRKRAIRIQSEIVWPVMIALAAGIILWIWTMQLDTEISSVRDSIRSLDDRIQQNQHLENEIAALAADKKVILEKIMALKRITVNRARWVRLLEGMCQSLPNYTWLAEIAEKDSAAQPILSVEGRTYSFPEVANYMLRLKDNPTIVGVDLSSIEQIDEKDRLFKFRIICTVDPNAGLTISEEQPPPSTAPTGR